MDRLDFILVFVVNRLCNTVFLPELGFQLLYFFLGDFPEGVELVLQRRNCLPADVLGHYAVCPCILAYIHVAFFL